MPPKFRIETLDDVEKIPDLITAIYFMKEHGLPLARYLKEAKMIISEFIVKNGPEVAKINRLKDRDAIQDALEEDKANRAELTKLYDKSCAFFKDLPSRFRDDLERVFPHFQTTLKEKSGLLKKSDCAIFVAGDTGSGKSTLINLLVGMQILPTHALQCTATLCELRRSQTRSIVLHYRDPGQNRQILECKDNDRIQDFQRKLVECVTETNSQTEESPYEKVEINWPFPMMQEGVVFVDTPGIGGAYSLDMEKYLDKALGFIYVINTGDAGGIHRDRLGRLLRQAMNHDDFDPATAVFVCNKWDQVEPREENRVNDFIRHKLKSCIPTISSRQIYKISAIQALNSLDYHKMTEDHVRLVEGIRKVLPITFHSNLMSYYRWLCSVLKRTVYSVKVSKQMDARSVQEKEELYKDVCIQIEALETRAESRVKDMRLDVKRAVEEITKLSIQTLSSSEQLLVWNSDLCPRPDSWKKVVAAASTAISSRVQDALDRWDRDKGVVSNVRKNIIKKFQRDVDLFQDQTKQIEGVFLGEDVKSIVDLHNSMKIRAPVKSVWSAAKKQGVKDEGFMSLGSAVGSATILDPRNSNVKALFKQYDFNKAPQIMQQATIHFIKELSEKRVTASVEKFFERYAKNIDRIGKMIPEFLRADRQLMKSLVDDVKSTTDSLVNLFPKLTVEGADLQGHLDMFFAKKLMKFDYSFDELNISSTDAPIGRGSFANVYFSKLTSSEGEIPIALKVCKDPLDVTNVTDVLLEDNILRDLNHRNVVRYFGASRQVQGRDIRWVMVLGYCPRTLQQKFVGKQADSPAKHDDIYALKVHAMKTVADFAEQICCGLDYLHSKKLVHRDMKPDNILLDEDDVVKLTDVGLAKRVQEISGTVAGSPVYMAPEVLLQKGQYDVKADMYSMGIILWEMWYGLDAADHIKTQLFTTFERAVEKGLRPSMSLSGKPPEDWHKLIVSCWDMNPKVRPTSYQAGSFFHKYLHQGE